MSSTGELDVAVVGSGPNGLAAAVLMARAGLSVEVHEAAEEVGGGLRSIRLFDSDVLHDMCAAVHPLAAASRFFREFDLNARGMKLLQPEVAYAHPLDGGRAGLAYRSLERTCQQLGVDGPRWRQLMGPLVDRNREVLNLLQSDLRHPPLDPRSAFLVATRVLATGTALSRHLFAAAEAPAMIAGVAAHPIVRQPSLPAGGIVGLLGPLAHSTGWSLPRGGSQRIAVAMVADLLRHGGKVHTCSRITDLRELRGARVVLLDLAPRGLLDIGGTLLPARYRRQLERYRYGPGAAKVDFLVSEPVPWAHPGVAKAGTVHLGGTQQEIYANETAVARGSRVAKPFVLVSDPMAVDPSRGLPGKRPVWAYCHVPHGDDQDPTEVVRRQIERFAPGFSETILASRGRSASALGAYNPNYVGGDIAAGAVSLRQIFARPVPRWNPYRVPLRGVYFCSAATPPGPGVHGMAGYFAAAMALRAEFGIREIPNVGPDQCHS